MDRESFEGGKGGGGGGTFEDLVEIVFSGVEGGTNGGITFFGGISLGGKEGGCEGMSLGGKEGGSD